MKAPMIAAGSWLLLPEALIRDRVGPDSQRFSHKAGRRPVVAAGDSVMGLVGFPRTTASPLNAEAACRYERHHHRRAYPGCCIDQDGWVVNYRVGIEPEALASHRVRCQEPDNTGLAEQVGRWMEKRP